MSRECLDHVIMGKVQIPLSDSLRALIAKAAKSAEAVQEKVAKAAEKAPADLKQEICEGWKEFSNYAMEPLLKHTDLIDVNYLIALSEAGGVVPRWQDVPDCARINATNGSFWRLRCHNAKYALPVLVLSYPWLDTDHPDRFGDTLRRILPILKACLKESQAQGGKHATFGVLWDFMSLPQGADRTPEMLERFEKALGSINEWYAHPYTVVLAVTTPLPTGVSYTNTRAYSSRGWCHFERRISALVKKNGLLWDLSRLDEGAETTFKDCCEDLKPKREDFVNPEKVARELREGVESGALAFTETADVDIVIEQYELGFAKYFSQ